MSYIDKLQANAFYGFNQVALLTASDLPAFLTRKPFESIYLGADITDPYNAQTIGPGMWWWNAELEQWIAWSAIESGTGTMQSLTATGGIVTGTGFPITTVGTISLVSIDSGTLMANITNTVTYPRETDVTEFFDFIGGNEVGSFWYRGSQNTGQWYSFQAGTEGQVLTSHGVGSNLTWENNDANASQWSLFPALQNVNMDGFSIKGPDTVTSTSMTISLPNIASGAENAGGLYIGGDNNIGSGNGSNVLISGGNAASGDGGWLSLQGGLSTTGSNHGGISLVSENTVIFSAPTYKFFTDDPAVAYATVTLGDFVDDPEFGIICPLSFIAPGTAGQVWTSGGVDAASYWATNESDASQWSTYPAVSNVNMSGFDIKGPDASVATYLTIALADISVGSNVGAGALTIGGDTNFSNVPGSGYFGSDTYIKAGNSQSLNSPGNLYLMGGTNPDETWGNINVSATYFNFVTDTIINASTSQILVSTITTPNISSGTDEPLNITIAPGSTTVPGMQGASVFIRSGAAGTNGQAGNIVLQPASNVAGVAGDLLMNGDVISMVGTQYLQLGFGDDISHSVLAMGAWNGSSAPVTFITGAAGYVLTSNGPGAAPTFEPNGAADASQWSLFPALDNVNMAGFNIQGPNITVGPAQNMFIALPSIESSADIDAGFIAIGGETNVCPGKKGSDTYIYSGYCGQGGTPGNINITAGFDPLNVYGNVTTTGKNISFLSDTIYVADSTGSAIQNGVMVVGTWAGDSSPLEYVTGTAGTFLMSNGAGLNPTFETIPVIPLIFQGSASGTVDGTNNVFTIDFTPMANSLIVYLNGVAQSLGVSYSFSGTTITFTSDSIPQIGTRVTVYYNYYS